MVALVCLGVALECLVHALVCLGVALVCLGVALVCLGVVLECLGVAHLLVHDVDQLLVLRLQVLPKERFSFKLLGDKKTKLKTLKNIEKH